MKFYNWLLTCFCKKSIINLKLDKNVSYIIWQIEKCPKTGKEHFQIYFELFRQRRLSTLRKNICTCHFEVRKGDQNQAIDYCSKQETRLEGPFEHGEKKEQGKRNDILEIVETIKDDPNINNYQLFLKHPEKQTVPRYYKFFNEIKKDILQEKTLKTREVKVTAIVGKPGVGKTSHVIRKHGLKDVYILNNTSGNQLWWDGYHGQHVLLIDDFYGWIEYSRLLRILDIYPCRLNIKGSFTYAQWDTVYITSNKSIGRWYNQDCAALRRRIHKKVKLEPAQK